MMAIHILTLFPGMFQGPFQESIVRRGVEGGLVQVHLHNIRDHAPDRHHVVDDYQYGSGPGMVLKPEPLFAAVEAALATYAEELRQQIPVILLSPQGQTFHQRMAEELAQKPGLVLLCGHYEGVDERVREHLVTEEISLGDFVLTGGEVAAMAVVDAVVRLIPGVVGSRESVEGDSITTGLLQHPLYTRPATFRGWEVPRILLSGNHAEIARWRRQQALLRTLKRRPDLLEKAQLSAADLRFLEAQGYRRP